MVRRCGAVLTKLGMTQFFTDDGISFPVTILKFSEHVVVDVKSESKHGYDAVVIGYGQAKPNKIKKPLKGLLAKSGVGNILNIKEFRVSEDCLLEIGKQLSLNHFVKGQYVDVTSLSIGKGFAGAMKRHNFSGLEASHGVSITHRSHGSTGNRTDPGKVFKGKKMAGHLGAERVTVQNLKILEVDEELSTISVLGAVPGAMNSSVVMRDAVKKGLLPNMMLPAVYVS